MRILPVLAIAVAATAVTAQSRQFLEIYPGQTSFTSRGNLGTGSGELHMGLHSTHWRGVGDQGAGGTNIAALRSILQDQNSFTQESYRWVVRSGSDANGPTAGNGAHVLLRSAAFNLPSTPTGSVNAWQVTGTLATPLAVPADDFFAWGIEATDSPNWTMDGLSMHTSFGLNPRPYNYRNPNGDHFAWQIIGNAAQASQPGNLRTWRLAIGVDSNILQLGADNSTTNNFRYGTAGMFPEPGAGLSVRIQGNGTANTVSAPVLMAAGFAAPSALPLFGTGVGSIWVSPLPGLIFPIGSSDAAGDLTVEPLVAALPVVTTGVPPVFMQAAYLGGFGDVTNANATSILP